MKRIIRIGLLVASLLMCLPGYAAVPYYDAAAAKAKAQADFANWMSYLPDDVFVAHVSIPGTHDTATAEGWDTSTGPTYSTTQEKTIDEQIAGGIRAFDFRPGMHNNELWCNHGIDRTKLKLADAFAKLKNYLAAHPGEFFVMHLFRGNVYGAGAKKPIIGEAFDDDASREKCNNLVNELFNQGTYADMFIEYSPYLKVKDVRGKVIVFRRDRIDFAHIYKAGNLANWPGDADLWNENSKVTVTLDSDPSVKGVMRVTDVSSPDNDSELQVELNSITNLFNWNCNQTLPNDAKRNGSYKPDWTMIFTSGAYNGENTSGYKRNASYTNPHFTSLIKNATKKGPTGIVLSDWVLTDNYSAQGVELVPTIIYNNFDYIQNYILDSDLFNNNVAAENIWDENRQYFMRNVATGNYLSAGEWWGSHATTAAHGIKITPMITADGLYLIRTTLANDRSGSGYFGTDWYVDNTNEAREFSVKYVGDDRYIFYYTDNGVKKSLSAHSEAWKNFTYDGTTHNVDPLDYDESDLRQQWELIDIEEYYNHLVNNAFINNGVDISFKIPGGRFFANDGENNSWNKYAKNYTQDIPGIGNNESRRVMRCYNFEAASGFFSKWSLSNEVTNLPNGIYTIKWMAYCGNITDVTMTINGTNVSSKLQQGNVKPERVKTGASNYENRFDLVQVGNEIGANPGKFTCIQDNIEIKDGKLSINLSAPKHASATAFILDDFELIYYGPTQLNDYPILLRALTDVNNRLNAIGKAGAIDYTEYTTGMKNHTYNDETEQAAALDLYKKLQTLALSQAPGIGTDYSNAIINGGFETGVLTGWDALSTAGDTGVRTDRYVMNNAEGSYVFNAYQNDRGTIISQTIQGLPAGEYEITATAAPWDNEYVYFEVKGDAAVTGQKSEAIQVAGGEGEGKDVSFKFNVAEGTPEITIYFGGCNEDGSFDDFGGRFYKVDNFRLKRLGDPDLCFFYKRLLQAIEDAQTVVDVTLSGTRYHDEWNAQVYQDLIDAHIGADGKHKGDPLAGEDYSNSGIEEIKEIYRRLRKLVFSQTETTANMTGAISNHSFEMGDLTGWTCYAEPNSDAQVAIGNNGGTYGTEGVDDEYLFNCRQGGAGYPIYQTIPDVPAGVYRLSCLIASDSGNKFYLGANDKHSEAFTTEGAGAFKRYYFDFEVTAEMKDVTIGLYPEVNGAFDRTNMPENKGAWYKVDGFKLELLSRNVTIEWTMETPTHGTIILPFDVSAEELAEKKLSVATIEASYPSDTPADPEVNTYHLLKYTPQTSIKANTPYLVKNLAPEAAMAPRKAKNKAAGSEAGDSFYSGNTYTFTDYTKHSKEKYENDVENGDATINGLFIGTLVDHEVNVDEHHLNTDGENVGFVHHEYAQEDASNYEAHEVIPAYHAYMINPVQANDATAENLVVTEFFFQEPVLPIEWKMEGEYYGTLILPFDAEIPGEFKTNNLGVYPVAGLSEVKIHPTGEFSYQIVETGDEVDEIAANTPYLVMYKSDKNSAPRKAPRKAAADAYEGLTQTFSGAATNKEASYTTQDKDGNDMYTGVLTTTDLDNTDMANAVRTLKNEGDGGSFVAGQSDQIGAYHAYLPASAPQADFVYLTEPNSDQVSGIEDLIAADSNVDVYDLHGVLLRTDVPVSEALDNLSAGMYILQCGDITLKVIK